MTRKDKIDPLALVEKLAAEERRFQEGTFLAPVVDGGRVRVRLQGIVYELAAGEKFAGWAILRQTSPGNATVVGQPSPAMIGKYLSLFPRIRLVLLQQFDQLWWALAASTSDSRIQLNGPVPVHLVGPSARFNTIYARFDGSAFWFECNDRRRDLHVSRALNDALSKGTVPGELRCPGAVPQERLAYRMLWLSEHPDEAMKQSDLTRIDKALKHAGASLQSFWYQQADEAAVRFTVDGHLHTVSIKPSDLSVLSAGICLSDRDEDFDLSSLVGVFRESNRYYE